MPTATLRMRGGVGQLAAPERAVQRGLADVDDAQHRCPLVAARPHPCVECLLAPHIEIADRGVLPVVEPDIDAVPITLGAAQLGGVLLPIPAQDVCEARRLRALIRDEACTQVKLGELLLGYLKLRRAKANALVVPLGGVVSDCVVAGRSVALSEPPLADLVVPLAVFGHAPFPSLVLSPSGFRSLAFTPKTMMSAIW